MTGSRRWFAYFDDDANERAVQLDESVYETTALGFGQSVTPAVANNLGNRIKASDKTPLEMRYIIAKNTDTDGRTITRKFYVGSTTAPVWAGSTTTVTVDSVPYSITFKSGENRSYIPQKDTGRIDGDVDDNITPAAP